MMWLFCFIAVAFLAGCTNPGTTTMHTAGDTSMRSIDSSKMINNTSRLPQDSATITVTQ
jgi:uncharacterized lipoprotein YajG